MLPFDGSPHCQAGYIYACHVVKGHRLACREEWLACQRFLVDLDNDALGFRFVPGLAEKACRFIEKLPHTKGRWAARGERIVLQGWQCFIVINIFGWVDSDGKRRFRDVYLKVCRKNGKSLLAAAIGLYLFVADGEFGAEVYSGATSEKQAWEIFRPAKQICERTPALRERYGIEVHAKSLTVLANGSRFEPLIGNPGDGASPLAALVDEYHEHDTDDLVETMETGMGAREQPLMFKITTAGSNQGGPCYLAEQDYRRILNETDRNERVFVLIFGIDAQDDWTTEDALRKANPNLDVSVSAEFLLAQQQEAIRNPRRQNAFKRKHLNVWVGAHTAWLNMESWHRCRHESLARDQFAGEDCVFSLDLASRIDITAWLQVFTRRDEQGKRHYYAFARFYLPEESIFPEGAAKGQRYQGWVNSGYITATDGEEIDFNAIQSDVVEEMGKYRVSEIVYDPWRATQLAQGLVAQGARAVEFRNTVNQMSPAMYELEAAIESGRFHHDGNPVLTWMASNVVAKVDAKDNIYPRKERPENKIDGMVALIMAVGRLMHDDSDLIEIPDGYEVAVV